MANYPQLDDCSGVWTLKQVNDAVLGGYWREAGSKAVFGGGFNSSNAYTANIDTIKMASAGNATDFGDLTTSTYKTSGVSTNLRGVRMGGQNPSSNPMDTMDYVTIASTGNATDFGDLYLATKFMGSSCDSHGGLQST